MIQPHVFAPSVFFMFGLLTLVAAHADGNTAHGAAGAAVKAAPMALQAVPSPADKGPRRHIKPPAPLKRLSFSAKDGFSLRMVSDQEVTAEIRNGAGRTLARTAYTLQAGDWTLKPRNLAPGLYTVLLRTGPNLRSLRMKIEDAERGKGQPEWVLEKAEKDSTRVPDPAAPRGAFLIPAPD